MISALTGELRHVDEGRIDLAVGPVVYELLVPASDVPLLEAGVGSEMTFHTLFYLEGDASRGGLEPRLIGFLRRDDKRFFELFTTVKGIGPKTALRALSVPVGEIAEAIESKDTRSLVRLNGIGKRTAELIVAELAGKAQKFVTTGIERAARGPAGAGGVRRSVAEEDAVQALMAMGERRTDAEHLLERAKHANPATPSTEGLIREMLRLRTTRP